MHVLLLKVLGLLLVVVGLSMLPPAGVSLVYAEGHASSFLLMAGVGVGAGVAGLALPRPDEHVLRNRGGFAVVALSWVVVSLLGAVPFVVVGGIDPVTAFFESASGFTTTGSTALVGLDAMSRSLLFFRQEIQWLGGIGVVVSAIALLPMLGIGGMQMMKAETTGPAKSDKLRPRIRHTAQALWRLYLLLTLACALAYWFAGMPVFDAVAHSLSTVSTGGYSIYDASIAQYDSPAIEAVAIVFMLLGAVSFAVHFRAFTQHSLKPYRASAEVRTFLVAVLLLTAFVAAVLAGEDAAEPVHALRLAAFEVVSVITSTGYGIADFSLWPTLLPATLIFIAFVGGCAGSTAGGLKVIRVLILSRQAVIEISRLVHPHLQKPLRIGGDIIDDAVVRAVWAFFSIYAFVFVALMLLLMQLGLDHVSAFGAVATCINNLGPGLGEVAANFHGVSDSVKIVSAFTCILGRLEVLTVFVLFTPTFWRG